MRADAVNDKDHFNSVRNQWFPLKTNEIILHYPPQYVIGKQTNDQERELARFENEHVLVTVQEVECEYMYSNPTGFFNTSLPDKMMRTKNYTFVSYKQFKDMAAKNNGEDQQLDAPEDFTREWVSNHSQGPVLALL